MSIIALLGKFNPLFLIQIGWRPGIGDPTFMGWLTVFTYLLASITCWLRSRTAISDDVQRERRFWQSLAVVLLLLGINKQLNFLSFFTSLSRTLAWQQEWWQERRSVQMLLIGIVVLLIAVLIGASFWRLRHLPRRILVASTGFWLLLGFVLIRATSLHAVDYYLYTPFAGIKLNWVFELGLLLWVLGTAVFPVKSRSQNNSVLSTTP
ncbi:MAG: hypothetical protein H6657_32270 [Ardenticatenaceae bacterium]|nr:hypothetical protein [Ardenticatenaceae bacterium]